MSRESGAPLPAVQSAPPRDAPRERRLLEALRLGIVPEGSVLEWTVGRDDECRKLLDWLAAAEEGALILMGGYGVGKSHLLEYLAAKALLQGYAVSHCHVKPGEENGCHPLRLYRSVMASLAAPCGGAMLDARGVLAAAALSPAARAVVADHKLLGPFLDAVADGEATESSWSAALGQATGDPWFPTPHDYTTVANVFAYLLSGMGALVTEGLGLRGLAVLIDEAEELRQVRLFYQWGRSLDLFRGLAMAANDEHDAAEEEAHRAPEGGEYRGAKTRLIYSGHRPDIPYVFRIPTHLKVVLAATEERGLGLHLHAWRPGMPVLLLKPLARDALRKLAGAVLALHARVTGKLPPMIARTRYEMGMRNFEPLGTLSVRLYIKAAIEILDALIEQPGLDARTLRPVVSGSLLGLGGDDEGPGKDDGDGDAGEGDEGEEDER